MNIASENLVETKPQVNPSTKRAHNFIDLAGKKFGLLTALTLLKKPGHPKKSFWTCACDCGSEIVVWAGHLPNGHTKSCGCKPVDIKTHGNTRGRRATPEYGSWCKMKERCLKKSDVGFPNYGGRGITICTRWLECFDNFLADMGKCPAGLSLDRINVNGNYEPGNCRWATRYQQSNNRRNNRVLSLGGVSKNMSQWEVCLGFPKGTLYRRVTTEGKSPEWSLTTPVRKCKKKNER